MSLRSGQVHNVIPPLISHRAAPAPCITAVGSTSLQRWASFSARLKAAAHIHNMAFRVGLRTLHHNTSQYLLSAVGVIQCAAQQRPPTQYICMLYVCMYVCVLYIYIYIYISMRARCNTSKCN